MASVTLKIAQNIGVKFHRSVLQNNYIFIYYIFIYFRILVRVIRTQSLPSHMRTEKRAHPQLCLRPRSPALSNTFFLLNAIHLNEIILLLSVHMRININQVKVRLYVNKYTHI